MLFKVVLASAVSLVSISAAANPLVGRWQGPCERRGDVSVSFKYEIAAVDANGKGTLAKEKTYYADADCAVIRRPAYQSVPFVVGEAVDGVATFDVVHRGTALFDIVHVSADGQTLTFGDRFTRTAADRPTVLSTDDRVFTRIQD